MLQLTATLTLSNLDGMLRRLPTARDEGVSTVGQRLATRWRDYAHVITGSYRASIYVQTPQGSDYGAHASAALGLNPPVKILPEVPRLSGHGVAAVASCVGHAIWEEFGARGRAGHPAFTPAVEQTRPELEPELRRRLWP